MIRKILLLILLLNVVNCSKKEISNEKLVKLSEGKVFKINFEPRKTETGENGLLVVYRSAEKRILKEKEIESDVLKIWQAVEPDAEKLEAIEGLVRYAYPVGETKDTKETVFEEKLFSAEKIENGTWKIRKVN